MYNIIFFGPQGSGKGTQAKTISKKINIPHISSGDLLRNEIENKTKLGVEIEKILDNGDLVPDSTINQIIKNRLENPDTQNGYILDGFPRTISQAEFLDSFSKVNYVIEIDIPKKVSIERLSYRYTCPKCGAIYHLKNVPPKQTGICDLCGTKLVRRDDDEPKAIEERLKIYHLRTEKLINYYKEKNILYTVDGAKDANQVATDILNLIQK